ncbi:type-2 ice-structuring protein-like isoform X2 [Thunnus thynnus]|uniref:type-2 ice-structuring protein-like isoform X2 n=1 Tax=Thunnus thynnus TaxID=8237 RepID=UPI003526D482
MLIVSLLVFAMMALTRAAALPEAEAGNSIVPLIQDALPEAEAGNGTINELMVPLNQDEGLISKTGRRCSSGWIEFGGRCFYYEPTATSWSEAQRNCRSLGANLASAHSIEELRVIERVIFLHTHWDPPTWLGGSDSNAEGVWRWLDGTPFDFTYWCPGEPNDNSSQDCLQTNYRGSSGDRCWDDMWCYAHLPSVCVRGLY